MAKKYNTFDDVVNENWTVPNSEEMNWEKIHAIAAIVSARELHAIHIELNIIRTMLNALGQDGLHAVIREQRLQIPALRAKRLKRKVPRRKNA
jgi:hypothetical protein